MKLPFQVRYRTSPHLHRSLMISRIYYGVVKAKASLEFEKTFTFISASQKKFFFYCLGNWLPNAISFVSNSIRSQIRI